MTIDRRMGGLVVACAVGTSVWPEAASRNSGLQRRMVVSAGKEEEPQPPTSREGVDAVAAVAGPRRRRYWSGTRSAAHHRLAA